MDVLLQCPKQVAVLVLKIDFPVCFYCILDSGRSFSGYINIQVGISLLVHREEKSMCLTTVDWLTLLLLTEKRIPTCAMIDSIMKFLASR
jgi:hypothetical protein